MARKKNSDEAIENVAEETEVQPGSTTETVEESPAEEVEKTDSVETNSEEVQPESLTVEEVVPDIPRYDKSLFITDPFMPFLWRFYYKFALVDGQEYSIEEANEAVAQWKERSFH